MQANSIIAFWLLSEIAGYIFQIIKNKIKHRNWKAFISSFQVILFNGHSNFVSSLQVVYLKVIQIPILRRYEAKISIWILSTTSLVLRRYIRKKKG